jgi:hypothetical protein
MSHPSRFRRRGAALLLVGLLFALPAHGEPGELPDDEFVQPGDEPLDLTTPLPESGRAIVKPKAPAAAESSPLNTKLGVGYRSSPVPNAEYRPSQLPDSTVPDQSTGFAWANVTVPDLPLGWNKASIETQFDPLDEQSKLGTTLSRSIPLGGDISMTLQNGLSVSRTFANSALSSQATTASQNWASSQSLQFSLLPTDTTVSFGAALSGTTDKWLRTLSAEQKLFGGPISLTGSVSETSSGEASKSLKAGFKQNW